MESRPFLKSTQSGSIWYKCANENTLPDKGWRLQISVLPEKANLEAAEEVMDRFFLQQTTKAGAFSAKLIEFKSIDNWDATQRPLAEKAETTYTVPGSNPAGKEICIYIHNDNYNQFYYKHDEYKLWMLTLWKMLEDAKVRLSYLTPLQDQQELDCEIGILTPFSYCAKKDETQRHGLLLEKSFNPFNSLNPFADICITKADLHVMQIKNWDAQILSAQRILFQKQALNKAIIAAREDFLEIHKNFPLLTSKRSFLTELLEEKDPEEFIKFYDAHLMEIQSCLPAHSEQTLKVYDLSRISRGAKKIDELALRAKYVREALLHIQKQAVNEIRKNQSEWNEKLLAVVQLEKYLPDFILLTEKAPLQLQNLYRRIVHISHLQTALQREITRSATHTPQNFPDAYKTLWNRKAEDPFLAVKMLLSDYIKGDSRLKRIFTFHWNRHHTSEINMILKRARNLDDLLHDLGRMHLQNSGGSLARRIEFIEMKLGRSIELGQKLDGNK